MKGTQEEFDQWQILRIDHEIGLRMENIIPEMQAMAKSYRLRKERAPFRNVLNVATGSGSGIEVTKNFIRYQLGRSRSDGGTANQMWNDTSGGKGKFAVALVAEIDKLGNDAKEVVKKLDVDLNTESGKRLRQQVHLRLMQLYLGNLARYQVFLAKEEEDA